VWRFVATDHKPKQAIAVTAQPPQAVTPASPSQPAATDAKPTVPTAPTTFSLPAEKPSAALVSEARSGKSKPACVDPTDACITGKVTAAQRGAILTSLREAKIKLCPTDSLRVSPDYDIAATGVRKNKQEDFQNLLRGYLRSTKLQGQVEIKCPSK